MIKKNDYLQHVLVVQPLYAFDVYLIDLVTVAVQLTDYNDVTAHDATTITVVHTDHYLNIPTVHGFVVAVDFERNGEMAVESMVVGSPIVGIGDALMVSARAIHHGRYGRSDRHGFHVQCVMCKRDYRLTDQCHYD